MKSSTVFVVLIVILIAFICCITTACGLGVVVYFFSNPNEVIDFKSFPQTGQAAPDFQLETIEGEKIALNDFRGKPVMVNFWAIWCSPCIKEMPLIQERYKQHHPDLVILAIEEDGKSVGVRDFIAESNFGFMVLAGSESVARQYNIRAYPTSFFIDEHGVIQSMVVGGLSGPGLDAELAKIGVGE